MHGRQEFQGMSKSTLNVRELVCGWLKRYDPGGFFVVRRKSSIGENCLQTRSKGADHAHGFLSVGLPSDSFLPVENRRVFWFPGGAPVGRSMFLACSRLGKQPESRPQIFDAIRTVACRLDQSRQFLISHADVASDVYVRRASELFDLPLIEFRPFPSDAHSDWFRDQSKLAARVCYYQCDELGSSDSFDVDEMLIANCLDLRVLFSRGGGKVQAATLKRLKSPIDSPRPFVLVDPAVGVSKHLGELIDAGAVPWHLIATDDADAEQPSSGAITATTQVMRLRCPIPISEFAQINDLDKYLVHWTRQRYGPWPHQSQNRFIDDLIMGSTSSDHSRMATLLRILATRRLIASNKITRDGTPVVCFTDTRVTEMPRRRRFRSHLCRWDFETIGLAVKRSRLQELGARAVIYADELTWRTMAESERPFFQIRRGKKIDWSEENEWRLVGDLDLTCIQPDDALVFVDTQEAADRAAQFSHWPVAAFEL
jgi:hypothetical protein